MAHARLIQLLDEVQFSDLSRSSGRLFLLMYKVGSSFRIAYSSESLDDVYSYMKELSQFSSDRVFFIRTVSISQDTFKSSVYE